MPERPLTPEDLAEELSAHLDFLTEVVVERDHDLSLLGKACEEFSAYYRALGICLLSGGADLDGFLDFLIQSGLVRRHYLQWAASDPAAEARHRRASFVEPAMDALAARQWKLAADIFAHTPSAWMEGEEYEDDFCHADAVRRLLAEDLTGSGAVLKRWEAVLEDGEDTRLGVCAALRDRDPAALGGALRAYLERRESDAAALADPANASLLAEEATFFPNRWISVEGLAYVALAEQRRMEVPLDLPGCPPLARMGRAGGFRSRGFPDLSFVAE